MCSLPTGAIPERGYLYCNKNPLTPSLKPPILAKYEMDLSLYDSPLSDQPDLNLCILLAHHSSLSLHVPNPR